MTTPIRIFTGNSNPEFAHRVCKHLGIPLGQARVTSFSDGETQVEIGESVRGMSVFLLQSTCPPTNVNIMEMLIMVDALKRASAGDITVVMPYYGYARQDRKVAPRAPITAKLVADLITTAGATRIISMDLHAGQIQGFFDIPFDHLYATPVILADIRRRFSLKKDGHNDVVLVAPDAGGVERARAFAKRLNAGLAIIDKRRTGPNVAVVMNIIGDVQGKCAIIVDDMIDTAGTLTKAAAAVMDQGAVEVWAYSTHAVLSGPALQRIEESPLKKVMVTDTVPLSKDAENSEKIGVLSVTDLVGDAIDLVHQHKSISTLFE